MSLRAGSRLGSYEIVAPLGAGGMGELYRAKDPRLGREVAIKVLRSDVEADAARRRRFEEEAKAASALNHPNIVTIHQIGDYERASYIVMELIDGATLRERLESGPLALAEVLDIARQLCAGLQKAHEAGVVHGDLKPENVMVDREGHVKIVDFGLARLLGPAFVDDFEAETVTREAPLVAGTLSYMAPEQALGKPTDSRADVFALGVVLYELTTGRKPFEGHTLAALIDAILNHAPSPNGLPSSLKPVVLRCLEKQPAARFASVADVAASLSGDDAAPAQISIAVVPFKHASTDEDAELFSDGLTEEIILDLSKIQKMRVISRTSAMMFKGTETDLRTIGRNLGVQYVLEGSVRIAGAQVRINAQLIDVEKDAHVWGDRFRGSLDDVFAIQEDISRKIVNALKLSLTPEEERAMAERPIDDLRAYEYYAQARKEHYRFTPDAIGRAIELLDKGIEIVGDNELLYAAKGISYWTYMHMELIPHSDAHRKAIGLCDKAFETGGRTSQAHFLRAGLATFGGDLSAAVKGYKKALEIQPGNSDALFWLCLAYLISGCIDASRRTLARLFEIDPLTPANYWLKGNVEWIVGEFEMALDAFRTFLDKDPNNPLAQYFVGTTLTRMGRGDEAEPLWQRVHESAPGGIHAKIARLYAPAVRGDTEGVFAALTPDLRASASWHFGVAGDVATACALGGADDEALGFLEQAVELGWVHADFFTKHDPSFERLYGNDRFNAIMNRARRAAARFEC